MSTDYVRWFAEIGLSDLAEVGGKNASLGEMINHFRQQGVRVPDGFALTAAAFRLHLRENRLDAHLEQSLRLLSEGQRTLSGAGAEIRRLILEAELPEPLVNAVSTAYQQLCEQSKTGLVAVAVRSSATAEDLPEASFAGQQESYLNVVGEQALLQACKDCYASLYTDRAIAYREEQGFDLREVALCVGVQRMVRSDLGGAGVAFTLDTETGFPDAVMISASWGLGESVVKGSVIPDKYMVFKPLLNQAGITPIMEKTVGSKVQKLVYGRSGGTECLATTDNERDRLVLSDDEICQLARYCCLIETHYGRPMDIEWGKDGEDGQLYILQARPETIESRKSREVLTRYRLKERSRVLVRGSSVGGAIATGRVCRILSPDQSEAFSDGDILVTGRTDPDWVPVMRRASGIITDTGGATSHAAIVSRELQVPAVVGAERATELMASGEVVTLCCAEGSVGVVYEGALAYETQAIDLTQIPKTRTDVMINMAMPDSALQWWQLPVRGIGLTRIEFIISALIRTHPMALLHFDRIKSQRVRDQIEQLTRGYTRKSDYFVDRLALGIAKIAASQYPHPVIVRMSDFKSNEYRGLLGGECFEIEEQNPMLGLRGASRYYNERYREAFELECEAVKSAREALGFDNIIVMIPFCRTIAEADKVLEVMRQAGLERGVGGLKIYVMCEIPSNVILADQFALRFDGFSIGSNDLTQLVLGIDRDSAELASLFDARDEAVKRMISQVIRVAHQQGRKVGICGQAPSDHPEFAAFLVEEGIDSISLNPDSVVSAMTHIAAAERHKDEKKGV